jgi:hypothetical protein
LIPFMYVYTKPFDQSYTILIILLGRTVLTFIGAALLVHAIEKRLGKLIVD